MASIAVLLNRLALHCPVRNLPANQAALLMQDTINDLIAYEPQQVAEACTTWRRGPVPFFPTSGQLIDQMPKMTYSRHYDPPPYKALEAPRTGPLKPWRQVLADKGLRIPAPPDPVANASAKPESLEPDGLLSEERRADLRALRDMCAERAAKAA